MERLQSPGHTQAIETLSETYMQPLQVPQPILRVLQPMNIAM